MLCHSNYYTMCKCNHQSSFYKLFPIRKKTKILWFQLYYLTSIVWQYHIPNRLILIARFLSLTFPYPRGSLIYRDKNENSLSFYMFSPPEFRISVYLKWMPHIFQLLNICKYSFSSKEYTRWRRWQVMQQKVDSMRDASSIPKRPW